jgi:hypothetical protein
VISNPGANPILYPTGPLQPTTDGASLMQSFDVCAMDPDFSWPQVWKTDLAIDQQLPWDMTGTLEMIYGKDVNAVYIRNADLGPVVRYLPAPDNRPYYGGTGNNELNDDGGSGIYVIDNTSKGHSFNLTMQLRKNFGTLAQAMLSYGYTDARNVTQSAGIFGAMWQMNPVKGDPNNPGLSYSEFGQRHRIVGAATYLKEWSRETHTTVGVFVEVAQGSRYTAASRGRFSFVYSGDVNGDGQSGNDLIYIPSDRDEIMLEQYVTETGDTLSPDQQWQRLDDFIEQDDYLSEHRGQIADRFGAISPWYWEIDLRVAQTLNLDFISPHHEFELIFDIRNLANLLNSDWGIRKTANASALSPLRLVRFDDGTGAPIFNFIGPKETFRDDPSFQSRWQANFGLRYRF